jgi:hypothetical protein
MTPFKYLSDPMHYCPLVLGSHIHRLQSQVTNVSLSTEEQKEYLHALGKMLTHAGETFFLTWSTARTNSALRWRPQQT